MFGIDDALIGGGLVQLYIKTSNATYACWGNVRAIGTASLPPFPIASAAYF